MSDPLETALIKAAKAGMTHLSLSPAFSTDGKTVYWTARAAPSTRHQYVSHQSEDPLGAVLGVLHALPRAPKRSQPEPRVTQGEQTDEPRDWFNI